MIHRLCPWLLGPIFLTVFAHAGGNSGGGGKPMLLEQVSQVLPGVSQTVVTYRRSCQIINLTGKDENPQRVWFLRAQDRVILDPEVFKLPRIEQEKIFADLSRNVPVVKEQVLAQEILKTGKFAKALNSLKFELTSHSYLPWLAQALVDDIRVSRFYEIPGDCFILANNQNPSVLKDGKIVGVRAFTRFRAGANVYFSSSVKNYEQLDLVHVIASELGHHLPVGKAAEDESVVNALANVLVMGFDSVESQAILSALLPKLIVWNVAFKTHFKVKERIESSVPSDMIQIKGKIPQPLLNLRNFLNSPEIQEAALTVLNGFNDLLGDTYMESMRSCSMSFMLYGGVEYDRTVLGTFEKRAPTELEQIKMDLYPMDRRFCFQLNNIFGPAFLEYDGYGQSSLRAGENYCLENEFHPEPEPIVDPKNLSPQKLSELTELNHKITSFHSKLCRGVLKHYSMGIPFAGTLEERKLILAVIGNDVASVEKYFRAGVNPNLKDTRKSYDRKYNNGRDFTVSIADDSRDESLMELALSSFSAMKFAPHTLQVVSLLIDAGADPMPLFDKLINSYNQDPLTSRREYPLLLILEKANVSGVKIRSLINKRNVCDHEIFPRPQAMASDIGDDVVIREYETWGEWRKIGDIKQQCR